MLSYDYMCAVPLRNVLMRLLTSNGTSAAERRHRPQLDEDRVGRQPAQLGPAELVHDVCLRLVADQLCVASACVAFRLQICDCWSVTA